MPQSITAEEEILSSVSIELERMFSVLSNAYSPARLLANAPYLLDIETRLKACLTEIGLPPPVLVEQHET